MIDRIGWLRAAVLGANDGIISTASLMLGVSTGATSANQPLIDGVAGLVAGATSMAAGAAEFENTPVQETEELAQIYVARGLKNQLAGQVMAKDALGAHARDELGITATTIARPVQAVLASAASFSTGAGSPLELDIVMPLDPLQPSIFSGSLLFPAILGMIGTKAGGADIVKPNHPPDVPERIRHGGNKCHRLAICHLHLRAERIRLPSSVRRRWGCPAQRITRNRP